MLIEQLMENPTEDMIRAGKVAMREYLRKKRIDQLEQMI